MTKLIDDLNKELNRLYHNASPTGKLRTESDYEADLFEEHFSCLCEIGLEDLRKEFKELANKYGEIEQFGRGGRTIAPCNLLNKTADQLKIGALEARWLLKTLKRFNDSVINWNKTMPDVTLEFVREEFSEQIQANKNKKRVARSVVSYE